MTLVWVKTREKDRIFLHKKNLHSSKTLWFGCSQKHLQMFWPFQERLKILIEKLTSKCSSDPSRIALVCDFLFMLWKDPTIQQMFCLLRVVLYSSFTFSCSNEPRGHCRTVQSSLLVEVNWRCSRLYNGISWRGEGKSLNSIQ